MDTATGFGRDNTRLAEAIGKLEFHDHLCLIYETRAEQFGTVIPFVRNGLARGEKWVFWYDRGRLNPLLGPLTPI